MNNSAFDTGERSAFDSWYNGMVGFQINSERILEDLDSTIYCDGIDPIKLRKWMVVCWNNALDAVQTLPQVVYDDLTYDQVESLKEPLDKQAIF